MDMESARNEMERQYEVVREDMQTAQLLAAFVTERLPTNLGHLPQTVRDLLASLEAWLRLVRRLGASSS